MNPAPTKAQNSSHDGAFSQGASMGVSNSTSASGNRPGSINARRDRKGFRGSDQPIYKGTKYKFHDTSANHPSIPKSSMKSVTRDAASIAPERGKSPSLIRAENGL